jgi:4-amino-4-deoxy-L-arabinose transferase-like glycosyltransferase
MEARARAASPSHAAGQPVALFAALAAVVVLRCWVAAVQGFESDEIYYWMWSQHLHAGYHDHPPMVALWIRASTALFGDGALAIRLPALLATVAASALLYALAVTLFADRAIGLLAVAWFNATPMTALMSVTMWPDAPTLVFWLLASVALARVWRTGQPAWWYVFGAATGFALLSKYTAFFLVAGAGLWIVCARDMRPWLRRPQPYLAAVIALALFAPNILWNFANDGGAFAKQFGRVIDANRGSLRYTGEFVGGQIMLASPLILGFILAALGAGVRHGLRGDSARLLLAFTALPLLVFLLLHAAGGHQTEGNWPSPVYPAAILAAVAAYAPVQGWRRRLFAAAPWVGVAFVLVLHVQALTAVLPIRARDDLTGRNAGWPAFTSEVRDIATRENAAFIMTTQWPVLAMLSYYQPGGPPVFQADEAARYRFRPPLDQSTLVGANGLYVALFYRDRSAEFSRYFERTELITTVMRSRNGDRIDLFRVYRLTGYRGGLPQ